MKYVMSILLALCIGNAALYAQEKKLTPEDKAINTKQKTPVKIIEYIVGTWKINDTNAEQENAATGRKLGQSITFTREAKYVTQSANEKLDSGRYRLNEDHAILYLESVHGGEPTEWNVSFRKNVMTLWPRETAEAHAQEHKYVYSRSGIAKQLSN
jgi:hypothetical protein